jgi:hypothetical protein
VLEVERPRAESQGQTVHWISCLSVVMGVDLSWVAVLGCLGDWRGWTRSRGRRADERRKALRARAGDRARRSAWTEADPEPSRAAGRSQRGNMAHAGQPHRRRGHVRTSAMRRRFIHHGPLLRRPK